MRNIYGDRGKEKSGTCCVHVRTTAAGELWDVSSAAVERPAENLHHENCESAQVRAEQPEDGGKDGPGSARSANKSCVFALISEAPPPPKYSQL